MKPSCFNSPEIIVVEASAGSGKTYALACRYVRLLLNLSRNSSVVPPIHSVLALTFTNKAAFEMKERILRFLKQLAIGTLPIAESEVMLAGMSLSPDEAREIAGRVIGAIFASYNYFQVQTIDRFIRTLLVGSAFGIGLTGGFRVQTDVRSYLEEALNGYIDDALTDSEARRHLENFLNSMLLVEARVSWVPRDVLLDTVVRFFGDYNNYGMNHRLPSIAFDTLWQLKSRIVADVKDLSSCLPEGVNAVFAKGVRGFAERHKKAFRFSGIGTTAFRSEVIKMNKGATVSPELATLWGSIHRGFQLAAHMEMFHLCDPYVRLFMDVRARFDALCTRDDVVFLNQLNVRAMALRDVAPLEMYYRLSTRFEHYLLDEFQDTSCLQWDNLKVLPEDGIARGGSLFYVGDKKQAIYSFRGGDTRLFDSIRASYREGGYCVDNVRLDKNYRSQQSIVAFVNSVFSLENLEGLLSSAVNKDGEPLIPARPEDFVELRRVYDGAHQLAGHKEPAGCVRVEALPAGLAEDVRAASLQRTIELLQNLRSRGFVWKDVAVLVRKNDEVAHFTRGLLEAGIEASSERTLNIRVHPHVQELVAFLQFLDTPVEDEAFAEVVQGELFLAAAGLTGAEVRDHILTWRQDKLRGYLYASFRRAFPEAWDKCIDVFFRGAGLYPLYELFSSIYRSWNVLERFPASQAFLMHLLGVVLSKEEEYPGLTAFLSHYEKLEGEELYVPATDANAVTVTTVHKAKGLDYNIVIIPFLAFNAQRDSGRGERSIAYSLRETVDGLALYHFNKEHTHFCQDADEAYVEDQMRHFFAELNAIYVALTRARWEMYIFMPPRAGGAMNLAPWLIPETARVFGQPSRDYPQWERADVVAPTVTPPPRCLDWMTFLGDEFSGVEDQRIRHEKDLGVALHAFLEQMGAAPYDRCAETLETVLRSAPDSVFKDECRQLLSRLWTISKLRDFFPGPECKVCTEFTVVTGAGYTRRMDRVIIAASQVTVVDFKIARGLDEAPAQDQVQEYKNLLSEIFPGREIVGALVYIREGEVDDV